MEKKLLRFINLAVGYDFPLIENINLQAQSGEIIGLIGRNGAGKSTFLKTLSGIIPVHKGRVECQGVNIFEVPAFLRAQKITIVLSGKINSGIKVIDFLRMGRYVYQLHKFGESKQGQIMVDSVISDLQLGKLLQKNLNALSDGEHQKVMIGRALVQDTPVLLLDEPTTHLDMENKALILNLLEYVAKKLNKIIILSTHEVNLVLPKVDRIWLVKAGKLSEVNKSMISEIFQSEHLRYDATCKIFRLN